MHVQISLVEASAYGALRPALEDVYMCMEGAHSDTRRYQQQLRLLARVTPERLGLPPPFCVRSPNPAPPPYTDAIQCLRSLPQATTPDRGLQCLVDVCRLVSEGAVAMGAPPLAADQLVPLIAFVCITSRLASLTVELALLQDLATDAQLSGESGYCLATFQVSACWHKHTYAHTCIHTYIHTYIHTCMPRHLPGVGPLALRVAMGRTPLSDPII